MQTVIDNFVEQVIQSEVYKPMDYSYVKNRVLALVGEEGANTPTSETDIKKLKDMLVELAPLYPLIGKHFCSHLSCHYISLRLLCLLYVSYLNYPSGNMLLTFHYRYNNHQSCPGHKHLTLS